MNNNDDTDNIYAIENHPSGSQYGNKLKAYIQPMDIPLTFKLKIFAKIDRLDLLDICACCGDLAELTGAKECVPCTKRYDDDREISFSI